VRQRVLAYVGLFAVAAAGLIWADLNSPAGVQRRGINAAEARRAQFAPVLARDRRFSRVVLRVSTRPALLIEGSVSDARALEDLHALFPVVPPEAGFDISWNVFVLPDDAATQAVQ
jgi:hypothetical protein